MCSTQKKLKQIEQTNYSFWSKIKKFPSDAKKATYFSPQHFKVDSTFLYLVWKYQLNEAAQLSGLNVFFKKPVTICHVCSL